MRRSSLDPSSLEFAFWGGDPADGFVGEDEPHADPSVGQVRGVGSPAVVRCDDVVLVAGTDPPVSEQWLVELFAELVISEVGATDSLSTPSVGD
jgi:hypothetical protein